MKLFFIPLTVLLLSVGEVFAQKAESLMGTMQADSVQVSRSNKRKERRDAAIRKQSRMLTRDLLEQGRLQFEPEYGFYHGNQVNMNVGHYTKIFANSVNDLGFVDGWHEDQSGGRYSGKPMLQVLNGRLYCNLEPILTTSRADIIGTNARDKASYGLNNQERAIYFETSDEQLSNWHAFNTRDFQIVNIKEKGDYLLSFDIIIKQFNILAYTAYSEFTFQCVINIHDARMTMRIIAGKERVCATYFGYMNILRGNSF